MGAVVPGDRPGDGGAGRREGDGETQCAGFSPLRPGGRRPGGAIAPCDRAIHRSRDVGGHSLSRDGVARGGGPVTAPAAVGSRRRREPRLGASRMRGDGDRPRARRRAPGPQAEQSLPRRGRRALDEGRRLWRGEGRRGRPNPHASRNAHWNDRLHGARAGHEREGRGRASGHLRPRLRALRMLDGARGVRGAATGGGVDEAPANAPTAGEPDAPGPAGGARQAGPAHAGEGPKRSSEGRGGGDRRARRALDEKVPSAVQTPRLVLLAEPVSRHDGIR